MSSKEAFPLEDWLFRLRGNFLQGFLPYFFHEFLCWLEVRPVMRSQHQGGVLGDVSGGLYGSVFQHEAAEAPQVYALPPFQQAALDACHE